MSNPQPEKVRVVVGDDHPLFREGVVRALSLSGSVNVVGEADDGAAALELIKAHLPDVALLDYRMPGMDGAQVAAAVRSYELPTRVLLISAHDEPAIVYQALQQGAAGFLLKDSTRTEIVKAVLDCAKGRDVVAPSLVGASPGRFASARHPWPGAQRARARGAQSHCVPSKHPRDRSRAICGAVDGKDPRATVVREARRQRPSCRGRRGDAAEAARLAGAAARRHVPTALSAANVHLGLRTGSLVVGASRMLVG
ncbi:nitrate/nitrite response transcriptional regulator NarL [Mycobacterium tuberculosis]|nr:nitrate/nitrite response transcriptional regulator NarL [Mycobacterium tuberculosis]